MNSQTRGFFAVLAASVVLSTIPTAIKIGLGTDADPLQLLAPRMLLGGALIWLWVALTRPHRARIDRQGLAWCALAGGINAVSLTLFYLSLERIDASMSILVFTLYPAILLAMLLLRGEPVTRLDWWRLVAALVGIWLVVGPRGRVDPAGVALAFATAVVYAFYVLVVHSRLAPYPASTQALWIVTFMALLIQAPAWWLAPDAPLGATAWGVVVWSAVLGTALARVLTLTGIRLLGGGQSALLAPMETVMTVTLATVVLGERMSAPQLTGGLLVIASVALSALRGRSGLPGWPRRATAAVRGR